MKIYNIPRGKGKTTLLAKMAASSENAAIITGTHSGKLEMCRKLSQVNADPNKVTVYDVKQLDSLREQRFDKILIDDIDIVLHLLLAEKGIGANIGTISATTPVEFLNTEEEI